METFRVALDSLPANKSVLVAPATKADAYWVGMRMNTVLADFQHGKLVDKVSIAMRYHIAVGEAINIRGMGDNIIGTVLIKSIRMARPALLSDADFADIGYKGRAEYMADWGEVFGNTVWLLKIERL